MKFLELNLLAFGPFTNVSLDFSSAEVGLHIVYGPNEAGKSSALRAIHAALFGVPHQSSDNFVHDHKALRIGAVLQNGSGQELRFLRRKGRTATLLNIDAELGPHPDHALDAFLGPVDADTFARVFAIGPEQLRQGGEQMRALRGLCGESLFAASLGNIAHSGSGLAEVLQSLDVEASELFSSMKRNSSIRRAKLEYEQAIRDRRSAEVSSAKWQSLQDELRQAADQLNAVRAQITEVSTQASRLQRFRDALKPLAERRQLLDELEDLGEVTVLPDTYSCDSRAKCQASFEETQRQIASLESELDGETGLAARIAAIHVPQAILDNEDFITDLQEQLGAHQKAVRDRNTTLQMRSGELKSRIAGLRRDLGMAADFDVETVRLTSDCRVGIHNLANDEKRLRVLPDEWAAKLVDLQLDLQSAQSAQTKLGSWRDVSELRRAIDDLLKHGDIAQQLEADRRALGQLQQEAQRQLRTLNLWQGTLTELKEIPLPLKATVDRFEQQFYDGEEAQSSRIAKQQELASELAHVGEEIAGLRMTDHVPTQSDLEQVRHRRQHGWQLVRQVWLDGMPPNSEEVREFCGDLSLADAYQSSVTKTDEVADRLRREAERIARLASRLERQSQVEKQLDSIDQQNIAGRQHRQSLATEWCLQWEPTGIKQPLSPREMRDWLVSHAAIKSLAIDVDRASDQLSVDQQIADACRIRLVTCLESMGETCNDESLGELLIRAQTISLAETKTEAHREQWKKEIDRLQREISKAESQKRVAVSQRQTWQSAWRVAMAQIGCPEDAPAEQANERLSRLEDLFKRLDELELLEMRIRDIDVDALAFEKQVNDLVDRTAADLAGIPAVEAAGRLRRRLEQARNDHARYCDLTERAAKSRDALQVLQRRQADLTQQLEQLCSAAGTTSVERLAEIEQTSRYVTSRHDRLNQLDERLMELSGGQSIDQLIADTSACDYDQLTAEMEDLMSELNRLGLQREEGAASLRELQQACDALDGSGASAEADERSLGILARMHDEAARFLQLRVAAALLRHQIEKFRAENQNPLLTRASHLFSRLTCREFSGLRTDYAENDLPVIVGVRRTEEPVGVGAMSDGTRDQLYLALRLAYLERRLVQHEPLPLIVDDVLVNFDNQRSLATMEVLAELSRQTQIIFFTHHRHLVEMTEAQLPNDGYLVHELEGRGAREPSRQPVLTGTRRAR